MAASFSDKSVIKVVTLGGSGVGKTALVNRIINGSFTVTSDATIGCVFTGKNIEGYKFEFWDTAGQERYRSITPTYYRNAKFIILMFDVSLPNTIDELSLYIDVLVREKIYHPDARIIVVGNKTDLRHPDTTGLTEDFRNHPIMKLNGFNMEPYYLSVKDNENVDQVISELVNYAAGVIQHPNVGNTLPIEIVERESTGCGC